MTSFFDLFAVLLVLAAAFGWLNLMYLHLPSNIGLLLVGVIASVAVFAFDALFPSVSLLQDLSAALQKIDFYEVVMNGVLSFLLFAGAMHVEWPRLRRRLVSVATLATVGVLISTFIVGFGFWGLGRLFGFDITLPWALVFGALISPTDPVAVLSLLKAARVPQLLETEMAGESLLNDGVGVVLFTILLAIASTGNTDVSIVGATGLFLARGFRRRPDRARGRLHRLPRHAHHRRICDGSLHFIGVGYDNIHIGQSSTRKRADCRGRCRPVDR